MPCNCGKNKPKRNIRKVSTIKDTIYGDGWQYVGDCGCHPPMAIHVNSLWPDYELRVDRMYTRIEVRVKQINAAGTRPVAWAGIANFKQIYDKYFTKPV